MIHNNTGFITAHTHHPLCYGMGLWLTSTDTSPIIIISYTITKWNTRAVLTSNVRIKASKQMLYKTTH